MTAELPPGCLVAASLPTARLAAAAQEAVHRTAMIISDACNGLLEFLRDTHAAAAGADGGGATFRSQLAAAIRQMGTIDWLVPPMLSKS